MAFGWARWDKEVKESSSEADVGGSQQGNRQVMLMEDSRLRKCVDSPVFLALLS